MDTCDWNENRFNDIKNAMSSWLKNTCGFESCEFVPIDGFSGINVSSNVDSTVCPWYKGKSLFEVLDDLPIPARNPDGPLRMPIFDKLKNVGFYLYGKLESGSIR